MDKVYKLDYDTVTDDIFSKMADSDINFYYEYNLFKSLNDLNDKLLQQEALLIIKRLINSYKANHLKHRLSIIKIEYKPFVIGIPSSIKYENTDNDNFGYLFDFEKNSNSFIKYVIKYSNLEKEYYKKSMQSLRKSIKNNYKDLLNVYIILKSIEVLQLDIDKLFDIQNTYIEEFNDNFTINKPKEDQLNKIDVLKYYFKNLNTPKS